MTEPSNEATDSSTVTTPIPDPLAEARVLQSEDLFSGHREILIAHGQEVYRLRLTRSNKLILHK